MASVKILGGATSKWNYCKLGEFPNGVGTLLVDGSDSYCDAGGSETIGLQFLIARYGKGTVIVTNGATFRSSGYSGLGMYNESSGKAIVTGSGSSWTATDKLYIGGQEQHATGCVVVADGGRITVHNTMYIMYSGVLKGNGGTVQGTVENSYGMIQPGSSIGTLTIDGDFEQKTDGTLCMELSGTALSQYDKLVVTGASTLAGTLIVTNINYAPVGGDSFELFDWEGGTVGMFDTLLLPPLNPGREWSTNVLYTTGTLHVIPEPSVCFALSLLLTFYAVLLRN